MRLKLLFFLIVFFVVCGSSYGQLLQWNTFGNTGTESTEPSVYNDANIAAVNLTFGTGVTPAANGNRFGGSGWFNSGDTATGNTLVEAVAGNDYIQFVVTPNSGYSFTPTSFVFIWDFSGTGPNSVTLRSSTDNYTTDLGTLNSMTTSTSVFKTINISGLTNITTATTFRIYGYGATATGGTGGFDQGGSSPGLVNVQLNGIASSIGPYSVASGEWNNPATWSTNPSIPLVSDNVTIKSGHTVITNAAITRNSGATTTVDSGGTLEIKENQYTNSGATTINGSVQISFGGWISGNSFIYGSSSTLIYNIGGTYGRGNEWQVLGVGTIGTTPGYPNNIQLSGNTTLNYNNGTPLAKAIAGNLTIDSGSSFYMDFGGSASGGALTVAGNVTNNGNLTLGNTSGDDLKLGGNFTNTGTFNGNDRAVFFTKVGAQIITSLSGITIPYVVLSGGTTIQLATGTNLTISAPLTGNAISFTNATDVFDINSNTLTIGTSGIANVINGVGTFKGSASSNLTLLGTGSVGTLKFIPSFQNLGTLTMNRQAATVGCIMGSTVTINTALNLTNGLISLGNYDMSLGLTATHTGSANSFVISDPDVGTGMLTKRVNSLGAFTLHIGENTAPNGAQYAPATINFSSGTFSSQAYYGVKVKDAIHPNIDSPNDYLTKYWIITSSGTFTTPVYSFTGLYTSGSADINGTESNCISAKWDGTKWTNGMAISGGTLTISGLTTMATSTTNEISAGNRNREINIKGLSGAGNNITSGSATANGLNNTLFAATNIGSSSTKDYEIQNIGVANLNLTGTPIVSIGGANPGDFTVTTVPSSTTIVGGASTTFVITFSPTLGGIRTAIVSIANNDSDENPYTFLIQGTGNCSATTNTITPTSGPAGTEVTINATANNLTGATVTFNGIAATSITYVSSTQIKVIVPSGAASGNLVTTNTMGCQATNAFTVINNKANTCQGGLVTSDLFISEVTDATTGGVTYVEIYNGTSSTVNLSSYALKTFSNGGSTSSTVNLNNLNLNSGSIYVVAIGITMTPDISNTCTLITGGNGELANQTSSSAGINFDVGGNDYISLFNISSSITIDSFGTYLSNSWADGLGLGDRGVVFRRKNTAILPSTNYSNSDWDIIDWPGSGSGSCPTNDYSDIGVYNFISGTPPTVTQQPVYSPSCKATSLTVAGTEGYSGGNPLAYQWYGVAPNVTTWTALTNSGIYYGATTATLNISNLAGLDGYQYYCQIRENGVSCYTASNSVKIVEAQILTWNGTSWSPSSPSPSLSTIIVIDGNYNTSTNGNLNACSVIVNTRKTLEITADNYVNIQNDLTVNGTLKVLDKGSLVMIDDAGIVTNNGITDIHRFTTPFEKFDYTYWSTPIVSTNIVTTFPTWRTDNAYEFFPANFNDVAPVDGFDDNGDDWVNASTMTPGKGYIIMGATDKSMYPTVDEVVFSGKVNNGVITPSIFLTPNADSEDDFNLIGNPYPSAVDADLFINTNLLKISGTLYFWTHKDDLGGGLNLGPNASNYSQDDYAMYNLSGGTATSATVGTASVSNSSVPLGYIASCQGFFVEAEVDNTPITFNNAMRVGLPDTANSQFFKIRQGKSKIVSKDRLWLNMGNSVGMFSQQLVGYFENATLGYDKGYDGLVSDGGNYVNFYSFIENKTCKIQGRSAFDENDQVRLGYFSAVAGTFNISIDSKEGIFNNSGTSVYLEDKLFNVIYDLKTAPYIFATESGTFNDRFILRYNNKTLGTADFETLENQVLISNKNKQIKVYSAVESVDKVAVYDLMGRQIYKKEKVNGNELSILNLVSSQQIILVKVTLQNGHAVTKKIVN